MSMYLSDDVQISAVIPTYNRGHLIGRAIESVLAQRKRPIEIIVVDDGSQDDTRQRVAEFGDRVTYLYQENAGSAVARHHGMQNVQTNWIALLDSDDVWVETHLERMAHAIRETDGMSNFYFADTMQPPEKGGGRRWEACGFTIASDEYELKMDAAEWVLLRLQPMMLQSTVFNRQAYLHAGGFLPQLRYRDDTHLFLKLGMLGPICAVANCGTQMTADDNPENRLTLTYNQHLRGAKMYVIMYEDLLATLTEMAPPHRAEMKRRLAYAYLALARYAWKKRAFPTVIWRMGQCVITWPSVFVGSLQRNSQKIMHRFQ